MPEPPTSPRLKEMEDFEVDLGPDEFEDMPKTPTPASAHPKPSRQDGTVATSPMSIKSNSSASGSVPLRSNKIKAAAAMWEKPVPTADPSSPVNGKTIRSPQAGFRSIAPGSSRSPEKKAVTVEKRTPEKKASPENKPSLEKRKPAKIDTSVVVSQPTDRYSEISLSTSKATTVPSLQPEQGNQSHIPEDDEKSDINDAPISDPAAPKGFFSSLSLTSSPAQPSPRPEFSRMNSNGAQSGGWRSTMTNLLSRSPANSGPASLTSPEGSAGPSSRIPSPSLIIHRIEDSTASRDRRISKEIGGGQKLREGFERVRGEMEGAAREMRREESDTPRSPAEPVDWTFWGAVVQDYEAVARESPKELSKAIQQGIPDVIRGSIWQLMSSSKSPPLEESYKQLLKHPSTHEKAITKDLTRTFPSLKFFQDSSGREALFMVLKAYSLYDAEVGYTQGVAFIVAALLLNMPDEEAFCVLVRLMDSYNLRSHYLADMPGLQLRLFQFDRLLEEHLPLTHTHLTRKGIKSSMYASQWFMTLFSYRFPLSLVYRVLDIVFAEGIEAIFRFSLALLKASETRLCELEFEKILEYLQTDIFEHYRLPQQTEQTDDGGEEWRANDFVRDAYEIRITPFMLDSYAAEFEEQRRNENKHAHEVDQLRTANRSLSSQVKQLEASLITINQEHVELVRQLVMSKLEKEEMENELVRYKMLYAELAHSQQDAMSIHSRRSQGSVS